MAARRSKTASNVDGSARQVRKPTKSRPHTEKAPKRYTPPLQKGSGGQPDQPPKRGVVYPKSNEGRDGWVKDPKFDTRTKLTEYRRLSNLPHHSFDVDGDGVVSQEVIQPLQCHRASFAGYCVLLYDVHSFSCTQCTQMPEIVLGTSVDHAAHFCRISCWQTSLTTMVMVCWTTRSGIIFGRRWCVALFAASPQKCAPATGTAD